ncbi:MAG TPA: hypothetical protein DCF33_19625, partial [Saprospirales bacterium]|nr:hypothetical protein [Saprospirales bacterium]
MLPNFKTKYFIKNFCIQDHLQRLALRPTQTLPNPNTQTLPTPKTRTHPNPNTPHMEKKVAPIPEQ